MTDEEQDRLVIEMANDVKWIKAWTVEHKKVHAKYVWYFISTLVVIILSCIC